MTQATKRLGILWGAVTASLLSTACGLSSSSSSAETEALSTSGVDCRAVSSEQLQAAAPGSAIHTACVVQGCGNRRSNRVTSNWSGGLFESRCQVGFMRWQLGNGSNQGPSSGPNGSIALVDASASTRANHGAFCTSLERMYANSPGERDEHGVLVGALRSALGRSPTEAGVKGKLSELMYCPLEFGAVGGRKVAIDSSTHSEQSDDGGNGRGTSTQTTSGSSDFEY